MTRNNDVVDLAALEGPGDLKVRLRCTGCPTSTRATDGPGESVEEVEPLTNPVRKRDDPSSIVRCAECGKKHSTNSLEVVGP